MSYVREHSGCLGFFVITELQFKTGAETRNVGNFWPDSPTLKNNYLGGKRIFVILNLTNWRYQEMVIFSPLRTHLGPVAICPKSLSVFYNYRISDE
jgi:hypothetical protein